MKLSQLFSGEANTGNLTKTQSRQTPAQIAQMNRQIRSLVPGQTLSGEIVSRNGSEVQIKLSEDMVLNARVDQNLNIEIGKNMTFEVKANGTALTLSPLFTNVATDVNVLKALEMAGLPVNESSVAMTEQLMGAGMSVNRNFLLQVYREINNFPQGQISDVINLHKLGMPVNEANMMQMESYRNLTHQLVGGMDTILGELPGVMEHMLASGDAAGATNLYQELFALVQGDGSSFVPLEQETFHSQSQNMEVAMPDVNITNGVFQDITTTIQGVGQDVVNNMQGQVQSEVLNMVQNLTQGDVPGEVQNLTQENIPDTVQGDTAAMSTNASVLAEAGNHAMVSDAGANLPAEVRMSLSQEVLNLIDTLQLPAEQAESLQRQMNLFSQGRLTAKEFFAGMNVITAATQNAQATAEAMQALQKIFAKPEFKNLLLNELKNQWMITPEEVAEPGKVEELYRKLDTQLKNLAQVLENVGQNESPAYKAVTTMSQNVDFLQQINQMYTYVQLPLKLQQQDANGELYVYANRKNLAENNGNISALLHLDMEHLGPVDVYVTMQSSKVNTKFYVRDDEMLDFLEAHMDLLTERLQRRGYDCSFSMTTRENASGETTEGGIDSILRQEKGMVLSQYAFDVRT